MSETSPHTPPHPGTADSEGWIPWAGGECPVPGDTIVEVRFSDETTSKGRAGLWRWRWWRDGRSPDIIAYRIVTPSPTHQPTAGDISEERVVQIRLDLKLVHGLIQEAKGLSGIVVDHLDAAEGALDRIEASFEVLTSRRAAERSSGVVVTEGMVDDGVKAGLAAKIVEVCTIGDYLSYEIGDAVDLGISFTEKTSEGTPRWHYHSDIRGMETDDTNEAILRPVIRAALTAALASQPNGDTK